MSTALHRWMKEAGVDDEAMAARVGLSTGGIRKLKYGERGASLATAAKIEQITQGAVRALDLQRPA